MNTKRKANKKIIHNATPAYETHEQMIAGTQSRLCHLSLPTQQIAAKNYKARIYTAGKNSKNRIFEAMTPLQIWFLGMPVFLIVWRIFAAICCV